MPGPGTAFYPAVSCQSQAAQRQAFISGCVVRLFKDNFTPSFDVDRATLLTFEANYTGYAGGGIALGAWGDPVRAAEGGYQISSPAVQFVVGGPPVSVGNVIGGFWVETSGGALHMVCQFPQGVPMQQPGAGFPVFMTEIFPAGG